MTSFSLFDENFYLQSNPDVSAAVLGSHFSSGNHHYLLYGGRELRNPNSNFDAVFYATQNPDVFSAVSVGHFSSVFEHYQKFGELENRIPSVDFVGFTATSYLDENPDVEIALALGGFKSALHHYLAFGRAENRPGSGISSSLSLTLSPDNLRGTLGDDVFTSKIGTLTDSDKIDGLSGFDTLNIESSGSLELPNASNLKNIEKIFLTSPLHQSLDFSIYSSLLEIELDSGTTNNDGTITLTLSSRQELIFDSITDADVSSASVDDGGLIIEQSLLANSLNLTLDDVGPAVDTTNENVFFDIAGLNTQTLNITNINDSFIDLSNSGGQISTLNLDGTGNLGINGTLPSNIQRVDGATLNANLTLPSFVGANTKRIDTGSGNDNISFSSDIMSISTGAGNDTINTTQSSLANAVIHGGDGTDVFNLTASAQVIVPQPSNLTGIESIFIADTVHQSLDFSGFSSVANIELDSGSTINGSLIITTLASNQALTLDSIIDGDTGSASLNDGGIRIAQANDVTSLELILDDIGPNTSTTNENVFIDIAGTGVTTANIASSNDSFVVLSNTGNNLNRINLTGAGIFEIGTLPNSITTVSGAQTNANITLTPGTGVNTVDVGSGIDTITLTGGTNTINTNSGDDTVNLNGGTNTVNTGQGNDTIISSAANDLSLDTIDGGDGTDSLMVTSTGLGVLPAPGKMTNIESIGIIDTVHQSLDFSSFTQITNIELEGGTTIDNGLITTTLATNQSLTLDSITDGDTSAASLGDGGIRISQASGVTSLELILDDVGPNTSTTNENVFIDIAGTSVSNLKVTSGNDSFVVISNSGGALVGLELLGTGTMALGTLPNSITNVNGSAASANLSLTIGNGNNTIRGGIGNDAITLTGGTNDVQTGAGDDTITTATNLVVGDRIDGGDGTDTFEVIHTGLATVPSTANLISIEQIAIQDTVHQSLNFSSLTAITGIQLKGGTTIDGNLITTTLGANQTLTLDGIIDGDTGGASLGDGGMRISHAGSVTSLNLNLDDIGPATSSSANRNVFIDIAGAGLATLNVTTANDNFVVFENSGGALSTLNLQGSGNFGIMSALPNSITTINGVNSSANLTLTPGTGGSSTTTGSGNDVISLTGGANTVNTNSGQDNITASGGTNNVSTGNGDDTINLTGGTNTIVTGNDDDTVTASAGNNDIDTNNGDDQVTLTGGTNDVNTGGNNDTVTLSNGTDTVDMGSGNDTVEAAGNLDASDTINGGSGTDILESTAAITDAISARLSNFEVLEIKGGGGITHDVTGLTGLTSLKASGALTGAIVVTDLAEAAEVDISTAIGNNLTVNQINSAGGSDTLTIDFSGGTYTTGGSIIAPNIETVTLKTSNNNNSTKTLSEGRFANAGNITIEATSGKLTILNLTALNIDTLDLSSSNKNVSITTGVDVFSQAFTFTGGSRNDTLDLDGATVAAGTVFVVGQDQDVLILNADAVSTTVRTVATNSNNAFSILDDATTANTASFTSGSDRFDYNGSLSHGGVSSVVAASGASLQAAVAADDDATVYVIVDPDGDNAFEAALNSFADNVSNNRANALETSAQASGLLSYSGLDAAFASNEIVLLAIDLESNEEATTANNGGTAVYRFQNSNTSTVDTVLSSELELIGVFQDAAIGTGDFV